MSDKSESVEELEVILTGEIPICPTCRIPTMRIELGGMTTLMHFSPVYNEEGVNTNPDRNILSLGYKCKTCNLRYNVKGNKHDGWKYF